MDGNTINAIGALSYMELLGRHVTDRVTNFQGVVTSVSFDLYGCVQCVVYPYAKDGVKFDEAHWAFIEAQDGFRERIVEELDRRLSDARNGRAFNLAIGLPEPQDHTRDYERVIRMYEMSVSGEVEITEAGVRPVRHGRLGLEAAVHDHERDVCQDAMSKPRMGSWSVHSDSDPRWNSSGRAEGLVVEGGPPEMQRWIEECRKKYGDPPKDCMMSFMKD